MFTIAKLMTFLLDQLASGKSTERVLFPSPSSTGKNQLFLWAMASIANCNLNDQRVHLWSDHDLLWSDPAKTLRSCHHANLQLSSVHDPSISFHEILLGLVRDFPSIIILNILGSIIPELIITFAITFAVCLTPSAFAEESELPGVNY